MVVDSYEGANDCLFVWANLGFSLALIYFAIYFTKYRSEGKKFYGVIRKINNS